MQRLPDDYHPQCLRHRTHDLFTQLRPHNSKSQFCTRSKTWVVHRMGLVITCNSQQCCDAYGHASLLKEVNKVNYYLFINNLL